MSGFFRQVAASAVGAYVAIHVLPDWAEYYNQNQEEVHEKAGTAYGKVKEAAEVILKQDNENSKK